MTNQTKKIILFDGYCPLCTGWVKFVLKRDKRGSFLFAPLDSKFSRDHTGELTEKFKDLDSIILLEGDQVYVKSTAALKILKGLNRGYALLYFMILIPPFFRNLIYDLIASNRTRWFGRQQSCFVPEKMWENRFLS